MNLTSDSIVYDKVYHGKASELILSYPLFLRSLKRRGLEIEPVVWRTYSIRWFGEKKEGKRKTNILCSYRNGTDNIYARPLEGITVFVDLDATKIIGYKDDEKIPLPKAEGNDYKLSSQNPSFRPKINPVLMEQSKGPSFKDHGHMVDWADLKFHLGFDVRVGPVISTTDMFDEEKGKFRSVMYRCFVSEMFVPYIDPTQDWYHITYMAAGELVWA